MEDGIYRLFDRERLNCTVNGNPRYRVRFTDGDGDLHTALTSSDSAFVYGFDNQGTRDDEMALIKFTKAGRIYDVRPA